MASQQYDFDLLCIGSGPAGQRGDSSGQARQTRRALVERRRTMGGVCVETGTIPSKTFREAVLSFTSVRQHFERHMGYPYESRATSSQLLARVEDVMRREVEVVADQLSRNDVVLIHGDAAFNDPHAVTSRWKTAHAR